MGSCQVTHLARDLGRDEVALLGADADAVQRALRERRQRDAGRAGFRFALVGLDR